MSEKGNLRVNRSHCANGNSEQRLLNHAAAGVRAQAANGVHVRRGLIKIRCCAFPAIREAEAEVDELTRYAYAANVIVSCLYHGERPPELSEESIDVRAVVRYRETRVGPVDAHVDRSLGLGEPNLVDQVL